ncbi:arylsulfatase (plasmid) [Deinococcus aetherius]|uniref:Arylsulfatase n=1 Tax=Deinococcus aetherius TaxID=200252 RepID=A0ABM8AKH1_9DEIO|nr:sulfatase-like hydrolase/transferase [Deinococcus aetherius]BDP44315.1 arylsulfatase [Deinococcus aetherius]
MSGGTPLKRPNILILMADQMRHDMIGAHGHPVLQTPHLDRLVREGVSLRKAYTESPVCVPARAVFLTGQLPHRNGVFDNYTPLRPGVPTFPRLLADAGYFTQAIGKMHFEPVREGHGFRRLWLSEEIPGSVEEDEFLQDLFAAGFGHVEEPHGLRHELYYVPQPSQLPEHLHTTAWTGRKTVEFLRERAGSDEPFVCFTSFIKPHPPFDPPAPWSRLYSPLDMPDPVQHERERAWDTIFIKRQHRFKWTRPDFDLQHVRTIRAYYAACVSFIDAWVGEILRTLDELGLAEDTLVVFMADHGEYLGDHGAYGKRGFHDAAARIPLVVRWPGQLPAGTETHALVGLADLPPTLLSAAGVDSAPLSPDGVNLLPLLHGEVGRVREVLTGQFQHGPLGLYLSMNERHKYIYSAADDLEILLNHSSTLSETENLAGRPEFAQVGRDLKEHVLSRLARDGHEAAVMGGDWRRYPRTLARGNEDDRDPEGRGWQFALWPETLRERQNA